MHAQHSIAGTCIHHVCKGQALMAVDESRGSAAVQLDDAEATRADVAAQYLADQGLVDSSRLCMVAVQVATQRLLYWLSGTQAYNSTTSTAWCAQHSITSIGLRLATSCKEKPDGFDWKSRCST
jgi:hypothetical protein